MPPSQALVLSSQAEDTTKVTLHEPPPPAPGVLTQGGYLGQGNRSLRVKSDLGRYRAEVHNLTSTFPLQVCDSCRLEEVAHCTHCTLRTLLTAPAPHSQGCLRSRQLQKHLDSLRE